MGTGAQLKALLTPLAGIHPASFDRYLTNLAEAGLVRRSGPGSGKAAIHLAAFEIASLLLALASPRPNEAAEAAKALGDLFPEGPREGHSSLRTSLAGTIETMAMRLQHGPADFGDADWEVTLCLNPLRATMAWPSRGPEATRRYFPYVDAKTIAPAMRPAPPFRRDSVLTQPLLIRVAKLYVDQNESAGSSPKEPAPAVPHKRAAGSSDSLNCSETTARGRVSSTLARSPPCPTVTTTTLIG
jgi:hypothetical protein